MSLNASSRLIFISVGEFSGDVLAKELVLAMKEQDPTLSFVGLTGPALESAGVNSLMNYKSININGFLSVLLSLAHLKKKEQQLMAKIDALPITAAILVDFPGLHFHLASQLKLRGILVIQYVAPKVWAWGLSRVQKLREDFDLVLGIFPFEQAFFETHKVPFAYVGCPHVDRLQNFRAPLEGYRRKRERPLIVFLPGSRLSEIEKMGPLFSQVLFELQTKNPNFDAAVPVADNLDLECVQKAFDQRVRSSVRFVKGSSLSLMQEADACLVASGTATLECGLIGTPMIVAYKMDPLSYFLAKRKVKIPYISLVNIILDRLVVSEYIQNIDVPALALELFDLAFDQPLNQQKRLELSELHHVLKGQASSTGAKKILRLLS